MDIKKDELESLLKRQAEIVLAESEKRNEQILKLSASAEARTRQYLGVLQEDFDHKMDVILEAVQPIPDMQEKLSTLTDDVETLKVDVSALKMTVADMAPKLDATFEKVGEIAVDVEEIKESVKDHEKRLQRVELRR